MTSIPKIAALPWSFKNYALYPHKTVSENMGMALKLQKLPKAEIEARVGDVAQMLGLTEYLQRRPGHAIRRAAPASCDRTCNCQNA